MKAYLPLLESLSFEKGTIEVLDLGCGRGEWIELLNEKGYTAKGIDMNQTMIDMLVKLNLSAEKADVIGYLRSLPPHSLEVVTGFHIVEHLPFETLMDMFREVHRVLKPGGLVIFETPNPKNIMVGTYTFYIDPTHINPIPSITLQFLLEYTGFIKVDEFFHSKLDKVSTGIGQLDGFFEQWYTVPLDYAAIGYKK